MSGIDVANKGRSGRRSFEAVTVEPVGTSSPLAPFSVLPSRVVTVTVPWTANNFGAFGLNRIDVLECGPVTGSAQKSHRLVHDDGGGFAAINAGNGIASPSH